MTTTIDAAMIPTPSQTVGPFVEIGCRYLASDRVVATQLGMTDVVVHGRVIDGDGKTVPDYMLEIWQTTSLAEAVGFARVMPLADGSFAFHTSYVSPRADDSAPHLAILVFMRGLLKPVLTRMYFPDDPRNTTDPVLGIVPSDRRATLIAATVSDAPLLELEWNVVLQGAGETVFFEW